MTYALIQDPDDSYYAVWMRNSIGWHHLSLGWVTTQDLALRRFNSRDSSVKPHLVSDPAKLLTRMQSITEFTVDSHPELFI